MKVLGILFLMLIVFSFGCQPLRKYPFPDADKLKSRQVCGQKKCQPGNPPGTVFHFTEEPYSPQVQNETTTKDVAISVLGHAFPYGDLTGRTPLPCATNSLNNPFKDVIVTLGNSTGRDVEYTKEELIDIDVEAAVEKNFQQITATNPNVTQNSDEIKAKLTAAYSRLNNKVLTVKANYSEWGLSPRAIAAFQRNLDFKDCKQFIRENNYRIITAVGIVSFDIEFEGKSLSDVGAEIESDLKKNGIEANIIAKFRREVSKKLKATTDGAFQIVVWRHIGPIDL